MSNRKEHEREKEVMVDGPQLKVKVTEERDGRFSACTDLPGCASWGNTEEEAVANVKDAIALYIYSLIDDRVNGMAPAQY